MNIPRTASVPAVPSSPVSAGLAYADRTAGAIALPPVVPPAAAIGSANAVQRGPLPDYSYNLSFDPAKASLTGRGTIGVTNTTGKPLDEVVLRLWANAPSITRRGGSATISAVTIAGQPATVQVDRTVAKIRLGAPLAQGEQAQISFDLTVVAPKGADRSGIYPQGMVAFGNLLPLVAVTDDEGTNIDPYVAAGESFYNLSGPWSVQVAGPADWQLATSGAQAGSASSFKAASARDFLIVAMKGWSKREQVVDGTTVRVWTPPSSANKAQTMLDAATQSLAYYNRRFGAYDGDNEYEVVASPGMGGGMEYPGITLNDPNSSGSFLREVVAHETGHQWFYSTAGNNQFDDPWLDESFTSYITSEFLNQPAQDLALRLIPAIHGRLRNAPGHGRSLGTQVGPVRVSSPMNVLNGRGYVGTIYGEGAKVLERLRKELGDGVFVTGMRAHVAQTRRGIATTGGFIETMSKAAGRDLTQWFAANKVVAVEPDADTKLDPNSGL